MFLKLWALLLIHCVAFDETVLALGDSYTIGEGVAAQERWPAQMVKLLRERGKTFAEPQIIAKTGWTTAELQAGIKEQKLNDQYDWVTLLIGVNNQYRQRDLEEYRQQFRELLELAIEKAKHNPKRVIVLSIPDWGVTPFALQRGRDPATIAHQLDQFNQVNREESEKLGAHYVEITKLTREAADQPEKFLVADQLHPSAEMYQQWAKLAAEIILKSSPPAAQDNEPTSSPPNIVFIITDDQGFGDLSAHGNPILRTPNLDDLHAASFRFLDFHVSPTCAPTRSALFTGRHEFKNGVTHTILERERLTPSAVTLADVLQQNGYATGIFGKWHLGDEDEYLPNRRGFRETFIHGAGGIGQSYPGSCGDAPQNKYFDPVIWHNNQFVKTQGYCTDVFFSQATHWIQTQVKEKKPFFAYIATNAPHAPYIARPEDAALYQGQVESNELAHFYGMIHNIDQNVGKLRATLHELGIANDTLLVFMNDNGTAAGHTVFNAGMRSAKGSPWLGGTRAMSFWCWPNSIQAGEARPLTGHVDVFPTIAELAGVSLDPIVREQIEGRSLVPLIRDPDAGWPDRYWVTHVGRWPKFSEPNDFKYQHAAIRNSRWSLVSTKGLSEPVWELFDLINDYGQTVDVAGQHPEVVQELGQAFDNWWSACRPLLVNEDVIGPQLNPFAVRYWQQFGGEPTEADRRRMAPAQPKHPSPR